MSRFVDTLVDLHNGAQPAAPARMIAALTPAATIQPNDHAVWLTLLAERLVRHLGAEGVPNALTQPISAACLIADLCALAEAPLPASVAELLGART